MAHFAKIENNKVTQVIVVGNDSIQNLKFPDSEIVGQDFIRSIGLEGHWLQTSYNGSFRKNFAGTGYTYNQELDAFIPPKYYKSWILDQDKGVWVAPKPYPSSGDFFWDEGKGDWIESSLENS